MGILPERQDSPRRRVNEFWTWETGALARGCSVAFSLSCPAREESARWASVVSASPMAWVADSIPITCRGRKAWRRPVGSPRLVGLNENI